MFGEAFSDERRPFCERAFKRDERPLTGSSPVANRANGGPVRSFTTAPARMKGTKNLSMIAEREMEHIGETKGAEKQSAIKSGCSHEPER